MSAPVDAECGPSDEHSVVCLRPLSVPATMPKHSDPGDVKDATDEEINGLRHVVDQLPRKVWISLLVSGAERFTFYVVSTPWRKYVLRIGDGNPRLRWNDRELHAE